MNLRLISICLSLTSVAVASEPPKIDRISPPGGQRGISVDVKLVGKPGDGTLKVWSTLDTMTWEIAEKQDAAKVTIPADASPGLHWVRFYNDHGATDLRPFIVGVIPEVSEVEPNDKISDAHKTEATAVLINGVLSKSGDVDTYSVTAKAGTTLVASMQANTLLGSPMDSVLQVLDQHGTVVAHNDDDHAMDPQIAFDVKVDGTYFVRTFAFPSKPNSTVRFAGAADYVYRLTLSTEAFVDHVIPLMPDGTQETAVRVHGWNLADELRSRTLPAFDTKSSLLFEGYSNWYQLTAAGIPAVAESDGVQTLSAPCVVSGRIAAANETDTYMFEGKKGQKLTISADCRRLNSLLDPVVRVTDPAGKLLKEADDRSRQDLDSEAAVSLRTDGTHSLTITDRFGDGGERYFYVIRLEETKKDFTCAVKANSFAVTNDKPLEIPVDVTRNNAFAETISFTVEGLPDGVAADAVQSKNDDDSKKQVTLKLSRDESRKEGFTGIIKIVATSESITEQLATAPIQNSTALTSQFWLTVPPLAPAEDAATK